ncbi:hypothetical protein ACU4GD_10395 [Cupriavidus basilensis]
MAPTPCSTARARHRALVAQLRADMLDAFIPLAQPWRDATVRHGVAITQQAVDGLAAW